MKRILVLGPPRAGRPLPGPLQVEVHHAALAGESAVNAADFSSVIVINDASSASIQRLLLALSLWRRQPRLRVGVMSYLDDAELQQFVARECMGAAPVKPVPDHPLPDLLGREPGLKIGLRQGVLSVEYQAV